MFQVCWKGSNSSGSGQSCTFSTIKIKCSNCSIASIPKICRFSFLLICAVETSCNLPILSRMGWPVWKIKCFKKRAILLFYCINSCRKFTKWTMCKIWTGLIYCKYSEIFARVLFSRNFAYAKFRENKTLPKWRDHSLVYWWR